jgi:hypothetical protein
MSRCDHGYTNSPGAGREFAVYLSLISFTLCLDNYGACGESDTTSQDVSLTSGHPWQHDSTMSLGKI